MSSPTTLQPAGGAAPPHLLVADNGAGGSGISATGAANSAGVDGVASGQLGYGLYGAGDEGYGVVGDTLSGIDLFAAGTGRLRQFPTAATGAPTTGSYARGEQLRDAAGDLYLCVADGSPGTWKKVLAAGEAVTSVQVTAPIVNTGTPTAPTIGIAPATASAPGSMSAADKGKLDGMVAIQTVNGPLFVNAGALGLDLATIVHGDNATKTGDGGARNFNQGQPSGFYDKFDGADLPTAGWYHLINARHRAETSVWQTQLAGHFTSESLYYRNIANGGVNPWRRLFHSGSDIVLGVNGSAAVPAIRWAAPLDGAENTGIYHPGEDGLDFATGGGRRLVLRNDHASIQPEGGNLTVGESGVGLGGYRMTVNGNLALRGNTFLMANDGNKRIVATDAFWHNSMGVGQRANDASPGTYFFHANGNAHWGDTQAGGIYLGWFANPGQGINVGNGAGSYGPCRASSFVVSSSARLKNSIEDLPVGLAQLRRLRPRRFFFNGDNRRRFGFIAEEVKAEAPELVMQTDPLPGKDGDASPPIEMIVQEGLLAVAINALQELTAKVATLEARLAALESGRSAANA